MVILIIGTTTPLFTREFFENTIANDFISIIPFTQQTPTHFPEPIFLHDGFLDIPIIQPEIFIEDNTYTLIPRPNCDPFNKYGFSKVSGILSGYHELARIRRYPTGFI